MLHTQDAEVARSPAILNQWCWPIINLPKRVGRGNIAHANEKYIFMYCTLLYSLDWSKRSLYKVKQYKKDICCVWEWRLLRIYDVNQTQLWTAIIQSWTRCIYVNINHTLPHIPSLSSLYIRGLEAHTKYPIFPSLQHMSMTLIQCSARMWLVLAVVDTYKLLSSTKGVAVSHLVWDHNKLLLQQTCLWIQQQQTTQKV